MSEYDVDIIYIKGTLNNVVDALIRRPHILLVIPLKANLWDHNLREQKEDDWRIEARYALCGKNNWKNKMDEYSCDDDTGEIQEEMCSPY